VDCCWMRRVKGLGISTTRVLSLNISRIIATRSMIADRDKTQIPPLRCASFGMTTP
jgi:hypothetical protein